MKTFVLLSIALLLISNCIVCVKIRKDHADAKDDTSISGEMPKTLEHENSNGFDSNYSGSPLITPLKNKEDPTKQPAMLQKGIITNAIVGGIALGAGYKLLKHLTGTAHPERNQYPVYQQFPVARPLVNQIPLATPIVNQMPGTIYR
jgi:hypothetical protein